MERRSIQPPPMMQSVYQSPPRERAAEYSCFTSLAVEDLFPEIAENIYCYGDDYCAIRDKTRQTLENVNMDAIQPEHRIHLLSSEHGFSILGGQPYVEMLATIREVIIQRTGCENVYLGVGAYRGFRESAEMVEAFGLDHIFEGKLFEFGPYDQGVPIETEVGTLHGIKKAYQADWIVHSYYDDPREMYFHRFLGRSFKAFVMSYARLETRSVYHFSFKNRSANFLPVAIYRSKFIQERYAFSCMMRTSPSGVLTIDADNDLFRLDKRITQSHLEKFGLLTKLFEAIDECIAVVDGGRWGYYMHAAGVVFGVYLFSNCKGRDLFDLDYPSALMMLDEIPLEDRDGIAGKMLTQGINPALKAVIINQQWGGIPFLNLFSRPLFVVGQDQMNYLNEDLANPFFKSFGGLGLIKTLPDFETALGKAMKTAQTDKVLIFDGSFGHVNLSPSLAEELKEKAPGIRKKVNEELLPKWLAQRGIVSDGLMAGH